MAGTLCLTVDNLGSALAVGRGREVKPDPDEPGLAVGLPRALQLFDELGLDATFFLEGWNGIHHPNAIETILAHGHEVALHGWVHERWATLTDNQREMLLWDGTAALRLAGADPKGFRAPGGYRGTHTAAVLRELDYRYDSSIEQETEDDPLQVHTLDEGITVVPWHWQGNDYWQYNMHPDGGQAPSQVLHSWLSTLYQAAESNGLMTLTVHPFVSFVEDARFNAVSTLLRTALSVPNLVVLTAEKTAGH